MTSIESTSVRFVLIHNGDKRYANARQTIEHLRDALSTSPKGKIDEIAWQPPITPHGLATSFRRKHAASILEAKWAKYRRLSVRDQSIFRAHRKFLKDALSHISDRSSMNRWRKRSAIEVIVTDKHIRGWQRFLESDEDFLLVMEDDALVKEETSICFKEIVSIVGKRCTPRELVYVDMAGGCDLAELNIHELTGDLESGRFRYYRKITTNTACCYLMSRALVERFVTMIIDRPSRRQIGIDWMMNHLLIEIDKSSSEKSLCLHCETPILHHGSATGSFESWQEQYK